MRTIKFWMYIAITTLTIVAFACGNKEAIRETTVETEIITPTYTFRTGTAFRSQAWGYTVGNNLVIISSSGHVTTIKNY
jgi:hypothetical protein